MAGKNITELDPVDSLTGDELMYVQQGGVDKSATPDDVAALAGGGGSSGTLGLVQLSDGAGGFDSDAGLSWDVGNGWLVCPSIAAYELSIIVNAFDTPFTAFSAQFGGTVQIHNADSGYITIAEDNTISFSSATFEWVIDATTGTLYPNNFGGGANSFDLGTIDIPLRTGYFGTSVETPDVVMSSGAASVIILPTSDPEVVGALWNNSGTITISSGP